MTILPFAISFEDRDPSELREIMAANRGKKWRPCLGIGCTKEIWTTRTRRFCPSCARRKTFEVSPAEVMNFTDLSNRRPSHDDSAFPVQQ